MASDVTTATFGDLLRGWRRQRRLTQLDLSLRGRVSTKHLSYLETGRAQPSREMALDLADHLDLPLRERDALLAAAGYAPAYGHRRLDAPEMSAIRAAVDAITAAHEPFPAVVVDRRWDVVTMNGGARLLAGAVDPALLVTPNVYRITLHPTGLAPRIANLAELAYHLLGQLRRDVARSGDPALTALLDEVEAYPTVRELRRAPAPVSGRAVVVPMRLRDPGGELALFTTITTFGTPADVTVDELALELFFPADEHTRRRLTRGR